jgi:hypothetical protein
MKRFLNWLLPEDPDDSAGYGPFRLPAECEWMQRAAKLHDYEFEHAEGRGKRVSEVDFDLFYRWVLEARSAEGPLERCKRASQICRYWPIARRFGRLIWDGE